MGKLYSIKGNWLLLVLLGLLSFTPGDSKPGIPTAYRVFSQIDAAGKINLFTLSLEGRVSYFPQVEKNGAWGKEKVIGKNTPPPHEPGVVLLWQPEAYPGVFEELTIGLNTQSRMVVLGLSAEGNVSYSLQDRFEPENWSRWDFIPAMRGISFKHITSIQNKDGSLQIFGLDQQGNVYYSRESADPLDPRKFTDWKSMYALNLGQVVCEKSSSGLVVVFTLNTIYGSVYHNWQLQPGSENWNGWTPLEGTELKSINVNRNPDGRLTLLAIGGDERLYERHQLTPEGAWSEWTTLDGSSIKQIVTEKSKAGRITVFALHTNGTVAVNWQLNPGGDAWSGWYPFGGNGFRSIINGRNEDGRMLLFAVDGNFEVQCTEQSFPDGSWGGWKYLTK